MSNAEALDWTEAELWDYLAKQARVKNNLDIFTTKSFKLCGQDQERIIQEASDR